jgi:hypothetical protein
MTIYYGSLKYLNIKKLNIKVKKFISHFYHSGIFMNIQQKPIMRQSKTGLMILLIILGSIATCLTGCSSLYFPKCVTPVGDFNGKIRDVKYYTDSNLFSIDIPPPVTTTGYVEDYFKKDDVRREMNGWVAFVNQYGYYLKFEVIDPQLPVLLEIAHNPDCKKEILDRLFSEWLVPEMKEKTLETEIFETSHIILENGEPALFAVFGLPKDTQDFDNPYFKGIVPKSACHRGLILTFSKNNYLILCDIKDMTSCFGDYKEVRLEFAKWWILKNILESVNSFSSNAQLPNPDSDSNGIQL